MVNEKESISTPWMDAHISGYKTEISNNMTFVYSVLDFTRQCLFESGNKSPIDLTLFFKHN